MILKLLWLQKKNIGFQIYCDQLIHFFFYLRYEVQLWEYKVQCFKQQVEFVELWTWE